MLDERCLALIHAEIDGTLSPQDRAELNRQLLADPEVRRQRDELTAACRLLETAGSVPLPADFSNSIVRRLDASVTVPATVRTRGLWRYPPLRYAASFGAGVVIAVLAIEGVDPSGGSHEFSQLAGTMAATPAPASSSSATLQIDHERLRGQAQLRQSDNGQLTMLEFQLEATGPLEVVAEFKGRSARIQAQAGKAGHFGVILDEPAREVAVRFLVGGEIVHQGVLLSDGNG